MTTSPKRGMSLAAQMSKAKCLPLRIGNWVRRIRHRCGYGIHSPWAFSLVTGVIYEDGEYYAYRQLRAKGKALEAKGWLLKDLLLLFRLTNHFHPSNITLCGDGWDDIAPFLHAACQQTPIVKHASDVPFILMSREGQEQLIIIPTLFQENPTGFLWKSYRFSSQNPPESCVTFDLYRWGLVYKGLPLQTEHYVINYF